jgi:hypothetical protein
MAKRLTINNVINNIPTNNKTYPEPIIGNPDKNLLAGIIIFIAPIKTNKVVNSLPLVILHPSER